MRIRRLRCCLFPPLLLRVRSHPSPPLPPLPPSPDNSTFIPWGNAYYDTKECPTSSFDKTKGMYCWIAACGGASPPADCYTGPKKFCQHGMPECEGDTVEACAIKYHPEATDYMPFIDCLENPFSATKGQACATRLGWSDWAEIHACAAGAEGQALDAANAAATVAFGASRLGTPWVVVNGKALDDPDTLLKDVCAAYKGAKPAGCN